jgi:hypothetical protein
MTTRAGLRSSARAELNDSAGTQLWTDALLNEWIVEAMRDFGRDFPKESSATLTSVATQAEYALAADCLRVTRVEHPTGFFRLPDPLSAGDLVDPFALSQGSPRVASSQLAYEVYGPHGARTLTLRPAPTIAGESIRVHYLAVWAEPAADADTRATPAVDDTLLIWLVAARALRWISTDESKRQRFERQRGVTTAQANESYRAEYRQVVANRAARAAPRRLVVRE